MNKRRINTIIRLHKSGATTKSMVRVILETFERKDHVDALCHFIEYKRGESYELGLRNRKD